MFVLRLCGLIEHSLLPFLLEAQQILKAVKDEIFATISPPLIKTGFRGRPKFDIPIEQLVYFLDNGFKVSHIASLFVSEKTIHRRLQDNGLSVHSTYEKLTDNDLDVIVKNMLQDFPNSGYKRM